MLAQECFQKLTTEYQFNTVMDIGSGAGQHSKAFLDAGKNVWAVDFGTSHYAEKNKLEVSERFQQFCGDFMDLHPLEKGVDCVWASHVLEHQPNPNLFLKRCNEHLKDGGIFAVTVPPLKHQIVGGHVTLWNGGLLLYHLILAGFDCSKAILKVYGYNISVIVQKAPVDPQELRGLVYDWGDVSRLGKYFPVPFEDGYDGSKLTNIGWDMTAEKDLGA